MGAGPGHVGGLKVIDHFHISARHYCLVGRRAANVLELDASMAPGWLGRTAWMRREETQRPSCAVVVVAGLAVTSPWASYIFWNRDWPL